MLRPKFPVSPPHTVPAEQAVEQHESKGLSSKGLSRCAAAAVRQAEWQSPTNADTGSVPSIALRARTPPKRAAAATSPASPRLPVHSVPRSGRLSSLTSWAPPALELDRITWTLRRRRPPFSTSTTLALPSTTPTPGRGSGDGSTYNCRCSDCSFSLGRP
ncbi:hypothetical protein BD626DRAFT_576924 [Schizophyllum amplum]|uniref:Uncharacterized protein n=1 Tax=Schizophyllum amplum TaxID=97359 RepID=A0A550BSW9_9AGAR|nr:hypothetical protein BD626DRAFT_576924 [Auriculariopsis ampla]